MDEPTAALTEQEAKLIFRIIRRLKEQAVAVIYISHYLSEVFEISDRIAVLRDGRDAGLFETRTASHEAVLAAMLGGVAGDLYDIAGSEARAGADVLTVENFGVSDRLTDVSFSVRRRRDPWRVRPHRLGDRDARPGPLRCARARDGRRGDTRWCVLPTPVGGSRQGGRHRLRRRRPQEGGDHCRAHGAREHGGALPRPLYGRHLRFARRETAQAEHWIESLGIRTRGPEQKIRTLSGGNQQKVCVSRWLVEGISLLILEEPTRGVDVGARREIYLELRALADRGLAVLVLSSDVEEVAGISDRSIVLDRGRLVGRFERGATPEDLMAATVNDPAFHAA